MEATADTSRVLMSKVLEGNIDDVQQYQYEQNLIVAVIGINVKSGIETVVGSVRSYAWESNTHTLDVRVTIEDGYCMALVGAALAVAGFELHFHDEILKIDGDLKLVGFSMNDVDAQRSMCSVMLKLEQNRGPI